MEIVLKGSTKVTESHKKFDFSNIIFEEEVTRLSDLETKGAYSRITVRVKVTQVSETTVVPTGKKKQDIAVVDGSGSGVFCGKRKLEVYRKGHVIS